MYKIIVKVILTPIVFACCIPLGVVASLVDLLRFPIDMLIQFWEE